jgi:formylglycine-generating enzyme required for sulfatase activity
MSGEDGGATDESALATVTGLRIDKYEVTVGRFRQFVNAVLPPDGGAGWLPTAGSGKHTHLNGGQGLVNTGLTNTFEPGWQSSDDSTVAPTNTNLSDAACDPGYGYASWTSAPGAQENIPINCVNWAEAYAFCIWDGGFLPSESEWEYTAAGGNQQREYPWGTTAPGVSNDYAVSTCHYGGTGVCTGVGNIAPVGTATLGVGAWGQLDLDGNVWEWNLDWYIAYAEPCADCSYLSSLANTSGRGTRGGGFFEIGDDDLFPWYRSYSGQQDRTYYTGFRCARTP